MNRTMLSLGYSAPMSAEHLTKGRIGRDRTSSVSPCMVESINCRCELNQRHTSRTVIIMPLIAG